jgi:hypothetical protein
MCGQNLQVAHVLVQCVPLKIICIKEDIGILSNTTSLRLNHMAHNMVTYTHKKNMHVIFVHIINSGSEHVPNIIGRWHPSY